VITKLEITLKSSIFLDSNFRLFNLSILVGYPSTDLSKLIKKEYGITYSVLILQYRLNYLDNLIEKEMIQNKKIKINKLIFLSGFNCRSNFYRSFYKMRKTNPLVYYNLLYP
jgi:AraC-like DNA-binding protein